MIDIQEKKQKILSFIETNGPSLPVQIAKAIEMDPVFASAILSELLGNKKIKMSHMKIGSSPLYLLQGQEKKLEELSDNLKSIEKEAYLKLRERKILKDEDENPAFRVALRNIKDFAVPFRFQGKIMWRYAFADDKEIEELLSPKVEKMKPEPKQKEEVEKVVPTTTNPKHIGEDKRKSEPQKEKRLENIFVEDKGEEGSKPEFLNEIKSFLKKKDIKFLEEIQSEKKEVVAKVSVGSKLGDINFLVVAKNKRTTSKEEIAAAVQRAVYNKMPCLFIIRKLPSKNIQKLIEENHLIKLDVME